MTRFAQHLNASKTGERRRGSSSRMPCGVSILWGILYLATLAASPAAGQDGESPESQDGVPAKATAGEDTPPTIVVVVGAGGQSEYTEQFAVWADRWKTAAQAGGASHIEIGRDPVDDKQSDLDRLQATLKQQADVPSAPLWLVLIGHGTFYRDVARFNLRGPDISAQQLNQMLQPLVRPVILINCASSSGPFLKRAGGVNRTLITATRSGSEQNFARFGDYFSSALNDSEADLDHDDQVSLLEAFLSASAGVSRFYDAESRLATEHALLDDNGDGLGTPADFFRGARAVRAARDGAPLDGLRARRRHLIAGARESLTPQQRAQRDALEGRIEHLRGQKGQQSDEAYFEQLEALLVPLAQIYRDAESSRKEEPKSESAKPE